MNVWRILWRIIIAIGRNMSKKLLVNWFENQCVCPLFVPWIFRKKTGRSFLIDLWNFRLFKAYEEMLVSQNTENRLGAKVVKIALLISSSFFSLDILSSWYHFFDLQICWGVMSSNDLPSQSIFNESARNIKKRVRNFLKDSGLNSLG